MRIYFLSSNPYKRAEVEAYAQTHEIEKKKGITLCMANLDIQEVLHPKLEVIVRRKALDAYQLIRHPCVVEHGGLFMTALPGLPGGLGKIVWDSVQDRMCRFLIEGDTREAFARAYLGYCDGRRVQVYSGETKGTIADGARGSYAFAWDPIFIPEGSTETYGEMGAERKAATSPIGRAWDAFVAGLDTET